MQGIVLILLTMGTLGTVNSDFDQPVENSSESQLAQVAANFVVDKLLNFLILHKIVSHETAVLIFASVP